MSRSQPDEFAVEIVHDEAAECVFVVAAGELDLSTVPELQAALHRASAADHGRVVLDLRQLVFIDSSGLRLLLQTAADARHADHAFAIIDGTPVLTRLFEMTGVSDEFVRYEP